MERVRRIVRRLAGPDSWIYSTAAAVLSGTAAAWREGPRRASQLRRLSRAGAGPPEPLQFRNLAHPIFARPGTPDIATVVNNIVREEYGRYRPAREPLAMIDAGGYIGDSSAYFLSRYPGLRVATLEPDRDNFELAERNLAPYGERARLLNAALFSAPGFVRIEGSHDGAFVSASGTEVQAMSVPEVMTRMSAAGIGTGGAR